MSQTRGPYRIAIAGGGVAGITFALICETLKIDYVLLEARNTLESYRGAGIGLQPNGLRILDQLGLLEEVEAATCPLTAWYSYDADGRLMGKSEAMAQYRKRIGYSVMFIERQKLLPIMARRLSKTECIKTNSRVTSLDETEDGIIVHVANGDSYQVDLVVGADGVKSAVRSHIDAAWPEKGIKSSDDYLSVSFATVYGMSSPTEGIAAGERFAVYREKETVIGFTGKDGVVFWFVFEHLDETTPVSKSPRYTDADAEELCRSVAHVRVMPDLTFGSLYKNRTVGLKIAVEEGTARTLHSNRAVIVGDAALKTTPAGGQGANQAIECCAVLINELMKAQREATDRFTRHDLVSALENYALKRSKASETALERSQMIAKALFCYPGQPTAMAKMMTTLPDDEWLNKAFSGLANAPVIDDLPFTARAAIYSQCIAGAQAKMEAATSGPLTPSTAAETNGGRGILDDARANISRSSQSKESVRVS